MGLVLLGGVGLGLVWGWLLAMLAWPGRREPRRTVLGLGMASLVGAAAIYALAGLPVVIACVVTAAGTSSGGLAWRADRQEQLEPTG